MKIRICLILMKILVILSDLFNYPEDSNFFDPVNKKVIGKMKDEIKGKIVSEFVRLKSKMYSLIVVASKEIKKGNGVNKMLLQTSNIKNS